MESSPQSFFPKLRIKKLSPTAFLPVKGSEHAAGYDLMSVEDTVVPARGKILVATGISMAIPIGNYGRVAPRSGLAVKNFIDVGAGVIDADATAAAGATAGEVAVLATNLAQATVQNYCQKAAQAVGGVSGVPVSPPATPVANVAIHEGS